jgi:uncharacterized protein YecT (DUF1311 family)
MKHLVTALFITISFSSFSQTQHDVHVVLSEAYEKSDKELNQVYQKLLQEYKSDTAFIVALTKAQRLWTAYRDAQIEMRFPAMNKQLQYGSVYPVCNLSMLKELTDQRTEELRHWLIGEEEGDMCQGALKILRTLDRTNLTKAFIAADSSVWVIPNIRKDHRIFGYQEPNLNSKRVILFSVFTNEVEGNPFVLKHRAYYGTDGMEQMSLKFMATRSRFIEVAILKNGEFLDMVYFEENDVQFEQ